MAAYTGGCHCGNLTVRFETGVPPERLERRACACSFCRAHGAQSVSDPGGRVALRAREPHALLRYRFGLETADFWVCGRCGVYVGALMPDGGAAFAIANANVLDLPPGAPPVPRSYEDESATERRARRRARWTPVAPEPAADPEHPEGRVRPGRDAPPIARRPATGADREFLWRLHRETMREAVDATWGWDDAEQRAFFERHFEPVGRREIVAVGGEPAGMLAVERRTDAIFLAAIEIAPSFQGRGLGTRLVGSLLAEAGRRGLPVELTVLKTNPARRFYERLGFRVAGETPTHHVLRHPPW